MPSVLHRQAEDPGYRRPRRQIPPQVRHALTAALAAILALAALPAAASSCDIDRADARGLVASVIDGDTFVLEDGRPVRLIGVDTPEVGRNGEPDQPGAGQATDFLAELLPPGAPVDLKFDAERRDRHGRLLAHAFAGGRNVQALILKKGLGLPLTVPPNVAFLDCYREAATSAAAARVGLWAEETLRPVRAATLTPDTRGYRVVRGKVTRRGDSRSSVWLDLDGGKLALRIAREDLAWFEGMPLDHLVGQTVEARGRVYRQHGQLRIRIRHPADLRPVTAPADS